MGATGPGGVIVLLGVLEAMVMLLVGCGQLTADVLKGTGVMIVPKMLLREVEDTALFD